MKEIQNQVNKVVITSIKIQFSDLTFFLIKLIMALIMALIVIGFFVGAISGILIILGGIVSSLFGMVS